MTGVDVIVPSPSGAKLLVVRNPENESPVQLEIWGAAQVEKEFHIPQSVHGSVYADEWFQGISWNSDEILIAYVAEEPSPSKPTFTCQGYKRGSATDRDAGNWKGQGEWEEGWGETYAGKRQPALFVININSGEAQAVIGIEKCLSVGKVVWAPPSRGSHQYLVFVGWSADTRKLGIKYCYNRPCALYAVRAPLYESEADGQEIKYCLSSSYARSAWILGHILLQILFTELIGQWMECHSYLLNFLMCNPWFSDGCTMLISSFRGSCQVVLSVNVLSGEVLRICPSNSNFSWNVLSLDGDNIFAVSSSLVDVPHIKYDYLVDKERKSTAWNWSDTQMYQAPQMNALRRWNLCSHLFTSV